ncbi:MAG TPA: hypothetical protein VGO63_01755 [Candidatus Paceibacterota bacterium]|nr:hypothetical protein [Candidatus Paceibacterota bacterium]
MKNLLFLGLVFGLFISITSLEAIKKVSAEGKGEVQTGTKGEVRNPSLIKHNSTVKTPEAEPREIQENLKGTLREIILDSFERDPSKAGAGIAYAIETPDLKSVSVEFSGTKASEKFRNADIEVEGGWNRNGSFTVKKVISVVPQNIESVVRSEIETLDANGAPTKSSLLGPEATTGAYTVLVIPVNFTDVTSQPVTVAQIRDVLYGSSSSINSQFKEMSQGRFYLTGIQRPDIDILDWVTLPHTSDNCPSNMLGTWANEARVLARAQGFEPNNYRSVVLIFPSNIPSCNGWGGQGAIGTLGSTIGSNNVWIQYEAGLDLKFLRSMLMHEMGHNLGLMHSSLVKHCQESALIPQDCQSIEYGDHFSPMGNTVFFLRNYNNFHLEQLGWLGAGAKVTNLPQAGTYNLNLFSPSFIKGSQVVSIPLKNSNGVPTGQSVYLEFRRQTPPFDMFTGDFFQNVTRGVSVRFAPSSLTAQTNTYLLDYTETTEPIDDAAIEVGQTYVNSTYGFSIRTNSINPGRGASITIQLTR